MLNPLPPVICLMGPTASGKTPLAVELVQHFPCEIISVDSAMVYRGMDIGTAKPEADVLRRAPHRLIDLVDPSEQYSAGQFRRDVLREIAEITTKGKVPLLVGGTMLYFRVLQQGIADLPAADASVRAMLLARAEKDGWENLHAELERVDPLAAQRINPNDSQRIQRALEVFHLTGKSISAWQAEATHPLSGYRVHSVALMPMERAYLHARIAERFEQMLAQGFEAEVAALYARGDLSAGLPSIRSVGYSQMWAYLAGQCSYGEMREQALAATRQLAKRQMTWLRSWPELTLLPAEDKAVYEKAQEVIARWLS